MKEEINLGRWTDSKIDRLLEESLKIDSTGMRIDLLSKHFLDSKYKGSTLIGDMNTPEVLVINLEGMDCFTFLDYIEAMRISASFEGFKKNLRRVRYRSGRVSFKNRNHFFTDWREFNPGLVEDVTGLTGAERSRCVTKSLNDKGDGTNYVPGVPCREREIVYLPSNAIDDVIIGRLRTGDYIGIYSEKPGLDVSHVGIVIKEGGNVNFRHASSATGRRKVVDEDFNNYVRQKPGIVVLRPMD